MATLRSLEATFLVRVQTGMLDNKPPERYNYSMKTLKTKFAEKYYNAGWDDGVSTGAKTTLDMVVSMLERERYRNKSGDQYYDFALKAIIEKIKELNA